MSAAPAAVGAALASAVCYGAADFIGGFAARRAGVFSVAAGIQAGGLAVLLLAAPFLPGRPAAADASWGIAAGLCGGAGIALLYRALAIGTMGVVSPITAVLAAALPVAAGAIRGEHLQSSQQAGIAAALIAVALVSLSDKGGRLKFSTSGTGEALASGILLGGFFIFLGLAPRSGGIYPLVFARAASTALLVVPALLLRRPVMPPRGVRRPVVLGGLVDVTANGLYVLAAQTGLLSIAAVLSSLYPAATVLLARVVLGERLRPWQIAGALLAIAGVALISS